MKELTERQREVLGYIKRYRKENHFSPTLLELSFSLNISTVSVYGVLKRLRKKGAITWENNKARTILPC